MPEQHLANVPKLNIFQNIRKFFLKRGINGTKYEKAPEYLKVQPDVIESLMSKSEYNVRFLSDEVAREYVDAHPEVIAVCDAKRRTALLEANPELFSSLKDYQQFQLVFIEKKWDFFKMFPKEKQKEFLTGKTDIFISPDVPVGYLSGPGLHFREDSYGIGNHRSGTLEVEPKYFADKLQYLDEDVVLEVIAKYSNDYDEHKKWGEKTRTAYYDAERFFRDIDFESLPTKLKLKMALIDNRLLERMDTETIVAFVDNNPLLVKKLPKKAIEALIKANPKFALMLTYDQRQDYLSYPGVQDNIPHRSKGFRGHKYNISSYDEVLKTLALNYDRPFEMSYVTDSVRNPELLWEVAKTFPQVLGVTGIIDNFTLNRKLNHVKDLLMSHIQDSEIRNAIQNSYWANYRFQYSVEECFKLNSVFQVLTNEKILERCDSQTIIDYINNPTMEGLADIVGNTYGDRAKEIFNSRPGLDFENIPSLKIFDETIFENFGEGVIHNQLTYASKFGFLLADFVDHPEKIAEYKKFERLTDGVFLDNVTGNEQRYKAFLELLPLIQQIDENNMTPERIQALRAVVVDLDKDECKFIPLERLEDLDTYIENRNKMYDIAMAKSSDIADIKDLLSRRFFGMPYERDSDATYRASTLSLSGMVSYYNIDKLLEDTRTYESDLLDEDEIDMLRLVSIIDNIKDPKVLQEIYKVLSEREDVLSPLEFQQLKNKIPLQYSRELVSQLLTPERAREMVANGERGIDIEVDEEGFEIINLRGADFKIMLHTLIGIQGGETNSGLRLPYGKTPAENWREFEKGCSTISTCLIEPNMLKSLGSDLSIANIGFCSIDPRLIIGMSHHDAHVSHMVGDPDPYFEYSSVKMNYPEELLRRTAAQITGQEAKDQSHEYNEIAMFRREQDLSKITSENYGGKIMPDYIVVYGKPGPQHKALAKAFAKNGKPIPIVCIDREYYRDGMYFRANQKDEIHQAEPKEDSELVGAVKKATQSNRDEER